MPMRFNRNRMNKGLSISTTMAMLVSLFAGTIVTAGTASAANTTYYVSAAGSDSNNGTSSSLPWKTLSKVSGAAFGAGDKILFRSGDSWSGQLLINDSGASGNPVTVGAYNTGSKPLINGGGNGAAILIDGASYVTVDGVAVTNYDGANVTDGVEGNRDGIKINGASSNITIRNNEIYNVEGFSNHSATGSPRGTSLDASANNMYMVGAIYQTGTPANNYLIENNYIHDNTVNGVLTTQVGTGLVIRSNTVNNGGADGIEYWNATSPLIEYNSVTNIGNNSGASAQTAGVIGYHGYAVAGIWGIVDTDQVVQYNYVANTNRIVWDGQAWDFDNQTVRGVYQYNFSRDNEGGFVLGGNTDQILRYNISYNDGSQQAYADQGFFNANSQYYNNVFYQNNGAGFSKSKLTAGSFKNNIFYTNASNTSYTNYQSGGPTFSNNGFGGTQSALNKGTASVTGDPLFVNPSSVGTSITSVDGFKLQSGSPMIDAGTSIASNGGKDYWGNTLYNGSPDIGAYEAPTGGTTPPPSGSDTHGGTWALKQLSTGTASGTGAYQTVSGVAASSTYVYNAWVKGAGQQGKLVVYDSSWNVLAESSIYTSTGTWTQVSTPSFSTGTNTSLNVQFIDTGTTAGTTYIDDAFLGISGGANKLTNAGFESGSTGWTMAAPYTIVQPPAPSNTHGGTWALKQLNTGTASGTGAYQAPTGIATSSTYVFKAWVRGAGQQGKLVVYDNSWNVIAESASYTASSTWTEISTPSFSTGTNTTLRVQFVDLGTTAGTTYLDDAFLGISGGTNKLTNPGFESGNTGWTMTGPYTIVQP